MEHPNKNDTSNPHPQLVRVISNRIVEALLNYLKAKFNFSSQFGEEDLKYDYPSLLCRLRVKRDSD
jgi:hypothetical protein